MLPVGEVVVGSLVYVTLCLRLLSPPAAAAAILTAVAVACWRLRRFHSHWASLCVPGPPPSLLLGNTAAVRRGIHHMQAEWTRLYGRTYGVYLMGECELGTSDTRLLRECMLQKHASFQDRLHFLPVVSNDSSNLFSNTLLFLDGDVWKRVRAQVTPVFTTGRIKRMFPALNHCSSILGDVMDEKRLRREEIDTKTLFGHLTLEMICRTGFGADIPIQRGDGSFMNKANQFFLFDDFDPRAILLFVFPWLAPRWQKYTGQVMLRPRENAYFTHMLTDILDEKRRQRVEGGSTDKKADFFDLLLDSLEEESQEDRRSKKSMTELEILAQGFVFLLAGYDTSSTTMSLLLFHLARYPEVQQRVWEEVDRVEDRDNITFDELTSFEYLDRVLKEVLRMYPTFVRVTRVCTSPTTLGGIPMRRGDVVSIPIRDVHYDEAHWQHPQRFDPDRFLPENREGADPLSFIPFGYGPRNCIGMRIAQFQIKLAIAHVIARFKVSPAVGAPNFPLEFKSRGPISINEKLTVLLEPRE